jgi:hypothetical protein
MLVAAGHQLHYEPQASVGHHVPAARLTQKWFLNRAYSEGLSTAVMRTVMERLPGHRRALMALHSSIDLLLHPRDWAGTFLRADEAERFASLCRTVRRAGLIWGLLAFSEARP